MHTLPASRGECKLVYTQGWKKPLSGRGSAW